MDDLLEKVKPFKKTAWIPIVENGGGSLTDSRFAGTPYLKKDEEYPHCPNCGNPIQLFLQLNLDQIPKEIKGEFGEGLIQLFYCTKEKKPYMFCEDECNAWEAFAKSVVVRLVRIEDEGQVMTVNVENAFPTKSIVGWTQKDDYPSWTEMQELGLELPEKDDETDESVKRTELQIDNLGIIKYEYVFTDDEEDEKPIDLCLTGDKMLGWANWVQGIEYPNCRICEKQMSLVFQLDSNDNLPFDFGDVGTGHITQCPVHKDELGFGWACG